MIGIFIKRPVFTTMLIMILVVFGINSYPKIGVDLYPDIELPFVNVTVTYTGASPEEMETLVTKTVETAVSSVAGIKNISSTAREGFSQTIIEFELGTDPRQASSEVREKIAGVRKRFPDNIDEPVIQRQDISAAPILYFSFSSDIRSRGDIRKIVADVVQDQLQRIDGVSEAQIVGASPRELRLLVDPRRLEAYKISYQTILNFVNTENVNTPGGKVTERGTELTVRTVGKYQNIDDIKNLVIANNNGQLVRMSDVVDVEDGWERETTFARTNGNPSVMLLVRKQSGTNTVDVAEKAMAEVARMQMRQELPPDITVDLVRDQSQYIRENVDDVWNAILFGGFLAVLITYLFLGDFKATVIGALAIPSSIISTFFIMKYMGFSLNNMSLMALSLAVGILIDDAIVLIENIFRHMQMGKDKFTAAYEATMEISLAMIATTMSLLAVFVPIGTMGDTVGQFFKQFGLTVAFSIAFSTLVAFSLTPMLSAHWLDNDRFVMKRPKWVNTILVKFEAGFQAFKNFYVQTLIWCLDRPKKIIAVAVLSLFFNFALTPFLGKEFQPTYDSGEFSINFKAPPGTSLDKMKEITQSVETIIADTPEVALYSVWIGGGRRPVYEGGFNVKLKTTDERKRTMMQIMDDLRVKFRTITDMRVTVVTNQGGSRGDSRPVQVGLRGSDLDKLNAYALQLVERIRTIPGSSDVDISSADYEPQIVINLDKRRAADAGVNNNMVGDVVQTAFLGQTTKNKFTIADSDYNIRVVLADQYRLNVNDVANLRVSNASGQFVRLGDIADVHISSGPIQIDREARQRQVIVYANTVGISPGDLIDKIDNELVPELNMPIGYRHAFIGQADSMKRSFAEISAALILAIIIIYMVLAAQFESFLYPIIIMVSLPFSVTGAILGLLLTGQTLNMISTIGFVMLMGLVTKNAILLVDYTNLARDEGKSLREALIEAGALRLRPILMTTLSTILGMLPIALGIGAGAELRQSMGVVLVGGLITSTILTLIVVPLVYLLIEQAKNKFVREGQ